MNEMKGFYSDQFGAIRAVNIDGEPWFNATDITTALGYRNSRDAIAKHVAREDARLFLKSQIATLEDFPNRGLTFINESGLYALIFGSKMESAKQFKRCRERSGYHRKPGKLRRMKNSREQSLLLTKIFSCSAITASRKNRLILSTITEHTCRITRKGRFPQLLNGRCTAW